MTSVLCLQLHFIVIVFSRNWNIPYLILFLVSFSQLWVTYLGAESMMKSPVTFAVSRIMWISPPHILQVTMITFLSVLPFYLYQVWITLRKEPQYYIDG